MYEHRLVLVFFFFVFYSFFFHCSAAHRDLHSFPTRRSSDLVKENFLHYLRPLDEVVSFEVEIRALARSPKNSVYMNPSIIESDDGFLANLRAVNFYVKDRCYYQIDTDEAVSEAYPAVTSNFLLSLDDGLQPIGEPQEIQIDDAIKPRRYQTSVIGYEDGRLFRYRDSLWMIVTSRQHRKNTLNQMLLLRLNRGVCEKVVPLHGYGDDHTQKNWMPLIRNDELFLVYSCDPLVILRPDVDSGECEVVVERPLPCYGADLRGGSQGVRVDGWYVFLTHEVRHRDDRLLYLHRFWCIDERFDFVAMTEPFYLQTSGIEYVCGMAADSNRRHLVIAWGENDERALLARVKLDAVIEALKAAAPS